MPHVHSGLAVPSKPVLTFGEPLAIFTHPGSDPLSSNRAFNLDFGGAELNTAIGLSRLGVPAWYAAGVGDDPFGQFILRELRAEGVDTHLVERTALCPTGTMFKLASGLHQDPSVHYYRSLSPMGSGQWQGESARQAIVSGQVGWVHASGITWMLSERTTMISDELIHLARDKNLPVSFDVNIRRKLASMDTWKTLVARLAPYITWMFLGDTEANALFGTDDDLEVFAALSDIGFAGDGLIVKCGEKGAVAVVNGTRIQVDAFPVRQVVDTVGAGDGFNAGWLAAHLRGWDMEAALRVASIVGAYAVTTPGDSSGYPSFEQVQSHLDGDEEVRR
ncbi:sugar kinase [Alicyclobacillus curvatus]|nr:sugar kinase [Alicyclobacillus curvatus]